MNLALIKHWSKQVNDVSTMPICPVSLLPANLLYVNFLWLNSEFNKELKGLGLEKLFYKRY